QPQLQRGLERRDAGLELHLRLEPVVDEIVIDAIDGDVGAVVPEHRLEDIERKGAVLPGAGVADAVHEEDGAGARPKHRLRLEWHWCRSGEVGGRLTLRDANALRLGAGRQTGLRRLPR